jgi:5-methyltetrahydropteroyltriglutamate--homocysteine methyltransferase
VLEFARKGLDDLRLLSEHAWDRVVGFGVIDVKSDQVESDDLVASRIRRALEVVPADRLMINPDCGLRHLPAGVARAKLRAMVAGTARVRAELVPRQAPPRGVSGGAVPVARQTEPETLGNRASLRKKAGMDR